MARYRARARAERRNVDARHERGSVGPGRWRRPSPARRSARPPAARRRRGSARRLFRRWFRGRRRDARAPARRRSARAEAPGEADRLRPARLFGDAADLRAARRRSPGPAPERSRDPGEGAPRPDRARGRGPRPRRRESRPRGPNPMPLVARALSSSPPQPRRPWRTEALELVFWTAWTARRKGSRRTRPKRRQIASSRPHSSAPRAPRRPPKRRWPCTGTRARPAR